MEDKLMYIPNDLLLHTSNSEIFRLKKVKMIKVFQLCIGMYWCSDFVIIIQNIYLFGVLPRGHKKSVRL